MTLSATKTSYDAARDRAIERVLPRIHDGIATLASLDLPHARRIARSWREHVRRVNLGLASEGGLIVVPIEGASLLEPSSPAAYIDRARAPFPWGNRSAYLVQESSLDLTHHELVTCMAHEGMERFAPDIHNFSREAHYRKARHAYAVLYDRAVALALEGRPYVREEGIERICARYSLPVPTADIDRRPFTIEHRGAIRKIVLA